ncbi:MAG: protein kinase [Verrucomicrobiae bacterium]|nr:protein kinase [Verrucomicrobiae bacterium]
MPERYEIKGKIARGGIGAIYRAFDRVMGREVALKRLLPLEETHLNESADESLQREAAALARFQHPNIVTIYAFEEDDDGPYVVMELVEGETLKETVERAALPVDDFIELTLQILDPLVAARDLNLLHRDIKPSNIMLSWLATGKFQIKVLDFGLAKFSQAPSTQTLDQTGSFLGSIDYLAPEQLELEPLDQRTDLYSLGCVLYFCLTQKPPFEGDNAAKTMRNHLSHQVTDIGEIRPDLPEPIADWLMRMISRYPNQRPADARAALEELQAARRGESRPKEPEPAPEKKAEEPLPVAIRVDDTPRAKVPPAKTKASGTRPHRPGSAPVRRPATGPVREGSQPVRHRTQPQLRVSAGASGPVRKPRQDTGPRKSIPRPEPEKVSKGKIFAIVGAIALLLILLVILLVNREETVEENEVASSSRASAASQSTGAPVPSMPTLQNPKLDSSKAPVPEVTDGLVAHFAASDAVYGPDFKTIAKPDERVTWWGNLDGDAAADHLLAVDARNQDRGPKRVIATPSDYSELARGIDVLDFDARSKLGSRGRTDVAEKLSGTAMTSIVVLRSDVDRGGVLRFEADEIGGVLNWDAHPDGYLWRMFKGSLRPTMVAKIGRLRNRFLVVTHVWNGEKVEQLSYLSFPGGVHLLAAAGDAPFKETPVHRYSIGGISDTAPTFQGQVAEWLIYDRALSDEERETVAGALADRYLSDRPVVIDFISPLPNGQLPPPRNPEANATTRAPVPPVTEALVGHFAASDFTFGNDLRHGARLGQRVMAWANLAEGSNADHLLAYEDGRPETSPLLAEVDSTEAAELNGAHRVVRFGFGEMLAARGTTQIQSTLSDAALSCFLVMRTSTELAPVLRMNTETLNPAAGISLQPRGFSGFVREADAWKSVALSAQKNHFAIVSLVWDAEKGTHRMFLKTPDGKSSATKPLKTNVKSLRFNGYELGHIPAGRTDTKLFQGDVAEVLIYGKALNDRDRKEVEDHLYERYFAK